MVFGRAGVSAGVAVTTITGSPVSAPNSVLGLDAAGNIPDLFIGDIYFGFVLPGTSTPGVTNSESFTIGDQGGDLDEFQIRFYGIANNRLDTQNVSGISRFLFTETLSGISRVEVDFLGTFGYTLDDLTFDTPTAAPVAEPGSMLLLGTGLTAFAVRLKRRIARARAD